MVEVEEITFARGFHDAHYVQDGESILGEGSFEVRWSNGTTWTIWMPEGATKEDWEAELDRVTKKIK